MTNNGKMDKILSFSMKIQENVYLKAISHGLAALMPLIIVGALSAVVDSLGIKAYQDFLVETGIKGYLKFPNMVTNGMLSVYVAFSVAYNLARNYKLDGFMSGFVSLMAYFLIQPFSITEDGIDNISIHLLGAEGIFTAIIVAIVVVEISRFLIKNELYVRMPAGVPEMVERSFKTLTSTAVVIVIFLAIKIIFDSTSIGTFSNLISLIIETPLKALGNSWIALLLIMAVVNLLWFFGIHGHLVALSVMLPVYLQMDIENLAAYQSGQELPHIIGNSFIYIYGSGACVLIGLVFWLWKAKTKHFRSMAKLSVIPAFFGIGEPLAFGVPYVLNFTLFIPVVFSGVINIALAYFATAIGLLPRLNGVNISGVPVGVSGFLTGGWSVALFQIFLCAVNIVIWAPFVRKLDQVEVEREQEELSVSNE